MGLKMNVFNRYAEYYDALYADKNYKQECDFIEKALRKYSKIKVKSILELGCGTGGHAIPLSLRKYEMTGIDASKVMLNAAKDKIISSGMKLNLKRGDIRNFKFTRKFDSIICMFAVLNYVTSNNDLEKTLKNVKRHLKKGGLFICDIWNGLAVMRILPSIRTKTVKKGMTKIIRTAEPELDAANHLCHNHFTMVILEKDKVVEEIKETHSVRYLFPQEITYYLEKAGFEVLEICEFPKLGCRVDENIWNISVIARG
ncbi:MAG: methyltransferase domain-containing protein [Phycisphaerae bacterium]